MNLFTLEATIGLNTSDYEQKIKDVIEDAKESGKKIDEAINVGDATGSSNVKTVVDNATQSVSTFGSTVKSILTAEYVQKGINWITSAGRAAVGAASDLAEIQNVVDVTFGDASVQINRWAETQAGNYGLSQLQAKQFTGYYGAMLQTAGIDENKTAEMAMNLAGLAGDLASFYNIGIEEAYQKIQSGLAGDSEPLKRFGINLGAETVEEYAGIKFSDMTDEEKHQARYDYLMDRTLNIQGDYMRTSDELANSQRTLDNNIERLSASFGEKLLPVMKAGTNVANDFFSALYSKTTEENLESIDETAKSTAANIESTAVNARAMVGVLEDYGDRSALTSEEQAQWNNVAKELIRTIPELSGLIDIQNGKIDGGTEALFENIDAWETAGKVSADIASLEEKKGLLADISSEIASEQAMLAIAEKQVEQNQNEVIALGAKVAETLGKEFNGTVEGARKLLDTNAGWYAALSMGLSDADISEMLSPLNEAESSIKEHKEKIASLKEEYDTVQAGIDTSTASMQESVSSLETSVSESFGSIGTAMTTLISSFDQSDSAYANAFSTGMGAADGLTAAYPAYAAAASLYSTGGLGGGTGPSVHLPGHATGLDYVPYDDYVARLHEGEAVLTRSEAAAWRSDGPGMASAQEIASAVAQAVAPLYEAISNISIVMDHRAVGHAVTRTVSENIATEARALRYCL